MNSSGCAENDFGEVTVMLGAASHLPVVDYFPIKTMRRKGFWSNSPVIVISAKNKQPCQHS